MVYLVPFSAQEAPSQGCGQTAGSESRSALTGGRADVHDPLRGLVVPRSQPCEGSPHTNPLAQRAMSACPLRSAAASLRKGIARRQPCEGSPHTNPLARRAMSACPLRSGADSLRKGIARSQPSEGSPHTNPLAQRAMSARPMRSAAASLRKGIARRQPCEGSPHTNPLAQRAMSARPMRSAAASLRKGIARRQPCIGCTCTPARVGCKSSSSKCGLVFDHRDHKDAANVRLILPFLCVHPPPACVLCVLCG